MSEADVAELLPLDNETLPKWDWQVSIGDGGIGLQLWLWKWLYLVKAHSARTSLCDLCASRYKKRYVSWLNKLGPCFHRTAVDEFLTRFSPADLSDRRKLALLRFFCLPDQAGRLMRKADTNNVRRLTTSSERFF